ncbi:MAG: extracellular solute-binding protein [Lachnospiraceae bacterium]|nr:extracellular solute-binding protein [Lachnospiraceae bacterium]
MKAEKKVWAFVFSVCMLAIALGGCGSHGDLSDHTGKNQIENGGNADGTDALSESTVMGRYVETATDLSGSIGFVSDIFKLEDGSLIIADTEKDFLMMKEGGEAWETDARSWKTRMQEESSIRSLAVGKDNTVGVIYDTAAQSPLAEDYNPFEENLEVMVVRADGTQVSVEMAGLEEETPYRIWISDTGRIFVSTFGPNPGLYEIEEDGSSDRLLTLESATSLIRFQNQLMIFDRLDGDGLTIYDMEQEQYIEDEVLHDFVEENYKDRSGNGGSFYDLYFFMGEENVLYLAGKKGLHRHVIGGNAIEQIIDGNLSSLGNPSYQLRGMSMVGDSEFMALFSNGRAVRYTYNPDIPTVPGEKLRVYSLRDNSTVRQAVNLYQTAYPDVYIEYEVGTETDSSVTREDTLKNLNMKLLAGDGPDVLILDHMPVDSYIEKGLLADLSPVMETLSGENALFENIVSAFRTEEGIYMMPCEIQLPVAFGKKEYTQGMTDLEGIADTMERLRENVPEKNLYGFCTKKSIMKLFSMISVPDWTTEKGEINEEGLSGYLVNVKRIYDAQMQGLAKEDIERYYDLSESYRERYVYSLDDSAEMIRTGVDYVDFVVGDRQFLYGTLGGDFTYAALYAVQQMEEYEDCETVLMKPEIFYPQTLTGISAVSEHNEQAQSFLRFLLGKENQSSLFMGFSVNRSAFDTIRETAKETGDEVYIDMGVMDENGKVYAITGGFPGEKEIQRLQNWMESVSVPYIEDDLLEEAVYEEGALYLEGTQSLENTLERIEKRVALYMAE